VSDYHLRRILLSAVNVTRFVHNTSDRARKKSEAEQIIIASLQIIFLFFTLDCGIVLEVGSTMLSESLLLAGGLIAEEEEYFHRVLIRNHVERNHAYHYS
jgi:hypothetical protein